MGKRGTLEQVSESARKATSARLELHRAIVRARMAKYPYRAIAEAAGLSHEQVRRLTMPEGN